MYLSTEWSCAASGVCLPLLPEQEELGQFPSVQWPLLSEPKVRATTLPFSSATWFYFFRLIHSFTCAGMLPVQYTKFSQFAGLGVLGTSYILRGMFMCMYIIVTMYSRNIVYRRCGYLRVVEVHAGSCGRGTHSPRVCCKGRGE